MNHWLETGLIALAATSLTLAAYWLWIQVADWRLDRRTRIRKRRSRP